MSSMNWLRNSHLNLVSRSNELHDDQPDRVASRAITSMSVKSCVVGLRLRGGGSTLWKIARNPSLF